MASDPRALLAKGDKLLAGAGGGFSFFSSKNDKYEDAADAYIQAANAFRMQKMNVEAGNAFKKAAQIQINNLKELDDAANTYADAFKVLRQDQPQEAIKCLDFAIGQYCARGNFRRAASHKENMGEVQENDIGDIRGALESYETAAGWYESDNANALANKLWLKVADLAALNEDYGKAIGLYEKVANQSISNNLMRYSVKDYFLKAGICRLASEPTAMARQAIEHYRDMDPTFASAREHQLLVDLLAAVEAGDQDGFTDKLYAFDQISKLDNWKTKILIKIKDTIKTKVDNEFA